jgi:outer membrane lipoprotein carrier protein
VADSIRRVESSYEGTRDFTAQFSQESVFAASEDRRLSSGKLSFMKPGRMDWEYLPPEEQRFISDGTVFYWYQPREKQVAIRDFSESFSSDLPVSFLLGLGKLSEAFDPVSVCLAEKGRLFEFKPKEESESLQRFYLVTDSKSHFPVAARIIDAGGNETMISLSQVRPNTDLGPDAFKFNIPRGTDVIDERSGG